MHEPMNVKDNFLHKSRLVAAKFSDTLRWFGMLMVGLQ
jgi:hypothetical protein